jgi:hypothetical protein
MSNRKRTRGRALLAAGVCLLLSIAGEGQARSPIPYTPPPTVEEPPPGTNTGCKGDCDEDPPPETPPGETNHMPEPATMVSGLIGAGLMSLYAARRRKRAVQD